MMDVVIYAAGFFLLSSLLVIIYNLFTAPVLQLLPPGSPESGERISILIPARNEESNIGKCLKSVLKQDINIHEIIVLDDQSTDKTQEIVLAIAAANDNVRLIEGMPLPEGWIGKTWACQQAGRIAEGDVLLFIDADVEMEPWAVRSALNLFRNYKLNMLSCFPTQKIKLPGEWFMVPLMNWLLLSFLPLKFVYSSRNKSFAAANGQFIMFDKESYSAQAGHEKVAADIVEDMELVRNYKSSGLQVMTVLGNKTVFCRMYNSFTDAFNGFRKNFFTGFNTHPFSFFIFILFLFALYFMPFILIFIDYSFIWLIIIIYLSRIIISVLSNQNIILNLVLHPLQIILMFITGIYSIKSSKKKEIVWKERTL